MCQIQKLQYFDSQVEGLQFEDSPFECWVVELVAKMFNYEMQPIVLKTLRD